MSTTTHHIWASSSSLNKSGMFQATGLAGRVMPVVAFPGSRRQPLIMPPLRSSKTFKPLACLHDFHGNIGMIRYHEVELEVRDYELDQFGVVNNAIYANYCQHGSHEMLKNMGINCDEVSRSGEALAVTELTLKFIAPLRSGYKFVVKSRISGTSATRIHCDQFIFKLPNYEPILEAKGTAVWLDSKNRPARLPSCLRSNSAQSQRQYTDFAF